MLSPEVSQKSLLKMFRKNYIATIDEVFQILDTNSRMSAFRRLRSMGYLTSFTNAGRYYTLSDIPRFDKQGLWFYQDVGFSHAGTLKATVIELVNFSAAGTCRGSLYIQALIPILHESKWQFASKNSKTVHYPLLRPPKQPSPYLWKPLEQEKLCPRQPRWQQGLLLNQCPSPSIR